MSEEGTLKELLQELAEERNFDFRGYKATTLDRRFRRRIFQLKLGNYAEYTEYIRKHPDEVNQLLNTVLINVTEFFRDPPAWEILRHELLPDLLRQLKPGHSFRAWSAGCATGEEPYSIGILVAEYFGAKLQEYDIKIYATDIDEDALSFARRGEYSHDAVKRIRPELREKYFHGTKSLRVNREIRRLVIFGCSNLGQDAPISHVNLLVCRNLLIYFDSDLQKQIVRRLTYALEPGGILFLGKAESQLTNSAQLRRLNPRWRIFQRNAGPHLPDERSGARQEAPESVMNTQTRTSQFDSLLQSQRHLLETLRVGVLALENDDTINQHNAAAATLCGLAPASLRGRKLGDTDLPVRIPELLSQLEATRVNDESSRFPSRIKVNGEEKLLEVAIRPLFDGGQRTGTLIYIDDQTLQEKLETAVEELESTSEELHSANEELETTNEELQSTNEELETTNEELQSTNEELETTNEELQSLNEELETTNQELEERTKDLDQVNSVYAQTLEKVRLPVILVGQDCKIEFWNGTALRLFGFKSRPPMEVTLDQLPLPRALKAGLLRRHRTVLQKREPMVARAQFLGDRLNSTADIHFSVIPREDKSYSVLMIFEPDGGMGTAKKTKKKSGKRSK